MLLLRSTDPDKCSSGAPTLYQLQGRRFSGAAVVLLSILLLRSQGHCSSRARGVAPQELGSKVGIAPEEEGVGKKKSKFDSQLWFMYGVFHDVCI